MQLIIVLLRIVLSVVFGTAGITKLIDQRGTQDAVKNFGSPSSLAPAISIVLPITELVIAAGLLFGSRTRVSALAALLMLGIFAVAISINLARGRTHDCHCFGQLHSRPLGWSTLVRDLVFALAAALVFWQASNDARVGILSALRLLGPLGWLLLSGVLLAAVVVLLSVRRKRQSSPAMAPAHPEGLPINAPAPAFELSAYEGGNTSLGQLLAYGKPLLLIFTNPNCGPCVALFAEIKDWQQTHTNQLTIAVVTFGTIKENFVNVARNRLGTVLLQEKREVAEKYGANVTPAAVLVDTGGRIASQLAAGADEIRDLLKGVLGNSHESNEHEQRPATRS
jgi:uncharacterized membrane protein YphA (DoxX/SURF4 family)/thiol-disulfide isomerase/thioredoxin